MTIELNQLNYGDYQTPLEFANKVCMILKNDLGVVPNTIIEPTCGEGNFIKASLDVFDNINLVYGVEIQEGYYIKTKEKFKENRNVKIVQDNIFTHNFSDIKCNNILIIGNPPWVTNSALGMADLGNLPKKRNFKGFKGLDAITGKGNFDIAEYIIIQMITEFKNHTGYIAMLCKNIVVKNILQHIHNYDFKIGDMRMYNFSAKEVFNASCEASLFVAKLGIEKEYTCKIYDINNSNVLLSTIGWVGDKFVSDVESYRDYMFVDTNVNSNIFEWRQGIKHDCSKVMEFLMSNNKIINGFGEEFEINEDIEDTYIYGLLKSSDMKKFQISDCRKCVMVTQKKVKEETKQIQCLAPKTWKYLKKYEHLLDARKSSIYKNSPKFSIFGVGEYSFKSYKVAISGMYKKPQFTLVCPVDDKPVMLDDTCYFLGFDNYEEALITCALLNSKPVQNFLRAVAFIDNKRPYTKDILMRINIIEVAKHLTFDEIIKILEINRIENINITEMNYTDFKVKYSELTFL
ncbi:hypothetical protein [Clostridium sp.]|uniref:hypothetical protein n=1 Tax=Clostridium sp. TaxID=1506 RepID=UPI002FDEA84A